MPREFILKKAFGEEKTIEEWARDGRCRVKKACLLYRISKNVNLEEALTRPSEREISRRACINQKMISGEKYGKLKVVRYDENVQSKTNVICNCDCGRQTSIYFYDLLTGATTSCGCNFKRKGKKNPKWHGHEDISGDYFSQLRVRARNTKKDFDITIEYIWNIFIKQNKKCYFSGIPLQFRSISYYSDGTASLDRIDCSKGYVEGNVRWVHKTINKMRQAYDDNVFIDFCKNVAKTHE